MTPSQFEAWLEVEVSQRINYVFHVGHALTAYFNVVFIEQLLKSVVSRKVLIN